MAASSCFPPVFAPIRAGIPGKLYNNRGDREGTRSDQDRKRRRIWLTDGGVFDNLATEPVWKNHRVVLVSDAGSALSYRSGCGPIWQLTRYTPIIQDQAAAVRKRWLIHSYKQKVYAGAYWGISSATSSYVKNPGYGFSKELATEVIARVRTDLDAFSSQEIAVLERHGYEIADMAIRTHAPEIAPALDSPSKYNSKVDEEEIRHHLSNSHKRCLLGRF
jgi:NTE family protein